MFNNTTVWSQSKKRYVQISFWVILDTFLWWLLTLWTWIKTNFVGKMGEAICRNETRKCYKGILAVQWVCNWVLTHMICKYAMFANFGWKISSLKLWFWLIFRKYFSNIFFAFFPRKRKAKHQQLPFWKQNFCLHFHVYKFAVTAKSLSLQYSSSWWFYSRMDSNFSTF